MICNHCGSDLTNTICGDLVCDNCEIVYIPNLKCKVEKSKISGGKDE